MARLEHTLLMRLPMLLSVTRRRVKHPREIPTTRFTMTRLSSVELTVYSATTMPPQNTTTSVLKNSAMDATSELSDRLSARLTVLILPATWSSMLLQSAPLKHPSGSSPTPMSTVLCSRRVACRAMSVTS